MRLKCQKQANFFEGWKITVLICGQSDIAEVLKNVTENVQIVSKEVCDVRDCYSVESTNKKHRPEAVVDCAGVSNLQEVANSTVEKWVEEVEVDLVGSYHIARATINENPNTRMVFYASSRSIR